MVIPYEDLSPEALRGVLEEYVSREGTDYGHATFSLAQKVAAVRRLLETGHAVIVFDPDTQSCNITARQDLPQDAPPS
ncbi:MAG: YheU family protein [Desulfobacterales bacterium]|nr:YheU family protein [Desulfobacterales bacterium]